MGLVALVVFTGGGASSAAATLDCPHHDLGSAGHQADSPGEAQSLHDSAAAYPEDAGHGAHAGHGPHAEHEPHAEHADHRAHPGHAPDAAAEAHPATEEAHHSHPSSHHEGPCTCLGDCAGATALRSVDAPAAERLREALPLRVPPAEPLLLPARFHLPHVLPWPTAPPHA